MASPPTQATPPDRMLLLRRRWERPWSSREATRPTRRGFRSSGRYAAGARARGTCSCFSFAAGAGLARHCSLPTAFCLVHVTRVGWAVRVQGDSSGPKVLPRFIIEMEPRAHVELLSEPAKCDSRLPCSGACLPAALRCIFAPCTGAAARLGRGGDMFKWVSSPWRGITCMAMWQCTRPCAAAQFCRLRGLRRSSSRHGLPEHTPTLTLALARALRGAGQ